MDDIHFLPTIGRSYKDRLDDDANEFIEYIVDGAQRMDNLISDLLKYSKVSYDKKTFENVNIKTVDNVLLDLSISIEENNVNISYNPIPVVFADPIQMGRFSKI